MGAVTARATLLHLDWVDYAAALLGRGEIDWADPAAVAGLFTKAQALLPSDLVIVPVGRIAAALPGLMAKLAGKPMGAQPLRTLLAEARLRDAINETLVRIAAGGAVLALGLPSPAGLAVAAASMAGLARPTVDEDLADDAAVYVADFLRAFAAAPIGAIVIDGVDPSHLPLLAPVSRVAAHYGWDVGLRPAAAGGDFGLDETPLPAGFWAGAAAPELPRLASITIPVDLVPEAVAAGIVRLRAAPQRTD